MLAIAPPAVDYTNSRITISGFDPRRSGGPHVPAPLEVKNLHIADPAQAIDVLAVDAACQPAPWDELAKMRMPRQL